MVPHKAWLVSLESSRCSMMTLSMLPLNKVDGEDNFQELRAVPFDSS
jgi:hypothetical protein